MNSGIVIRILAVVLLAAAIIIGVWWYLNNEDQLDAEAAVIAAHAIVGLVQPR